MCIRDLDGEGAHLSRPAVEYSRQDVLHTHEIGNEGVGRPLEYIPDLTGLDDGAVVHDGPGGAHDQPHQNAPPGKRKGNPDKGVPRGGAQAAGNIFQPGRNGLESGLEGVYAVRLTNVFPMIKASLAINLNKTLDHIWHSCHIRHMPCFP